LDRSGYLGVGQREAYNSIDVSSSSNLLESLDVSSCSLLSDLVCDYNVLTQLDVSNNGGIFRMRLNASLNQIGKKII